MLFIVASKLAFPRQKFIVLKNNHLTKYREKSSQLSVQQQVRVFLPHAINDRQGQAFGLAQHLIGPDSFCLVSSLLSFSSRVFTPGAFRLCGSESKVRIKRTPTRSPVEKMGVLFLLQGL